MGPVYKKFVEAVKLVELGAAFPAQGSAEALTLVNNLVADHERRTAIGEKLNSFMTRETGAAGRILQQIQQDALL